MSTHQLQPERKSSAPVEAQRVPVLFRSHYICPPICQMSLHPVCIVFFLFSSWLIVRRKHIRCISLPVFLQPKYSFFLQFALSSCSCTGRVRLPLARFLDFL